MPRVDALVRYALALLARSIGEPVPWPLYDPRVGQPVEPPSDPTALLREARAVIEAALGDGERETLHALIADFHAVTDPEAHPDLDARANAVLANCIDGCVPLPVACRMCHGCAQCEPQGECNDAKGCDGSGLVAEEPSPAPDAAQKEPQP